MFKTVAMISVAFSLVSISAPSAATEDDIVFNMNADVSRGSRALKRQDFQAASKFLTRASKANLGQKTMVRTLGNLCAADYLLGKLEVAKESCDKAIKMDKRAWRPYVIRGHIHGEQGERDLAKADYSTAQEIKPGERISIKYLAKLEQNNVQLAQIK